MKINTQVMVTPSNDNDCYDKFRNKVLIVTHTARSIKDHPGYDEEMEGEVLHDLEDLEGNSIPCSLYSCELIRV